MRLFRFFITFLIAASPLIPVLAADSTGVKRQQQTAVPQDAGNREAEYTAARAACDQGTTPKERELCINQVKAEYGEMLGR